MGHSTYNYWRKKFLTEEEPHELAPISFRESSHHQSSSAVFSGDLPSGATLLFPNGLRAHFGTGTESMLMELLEKSLVSHVLPERHYALLSVSGEDGYAQRHQFAVRSGT